MVGGVISKKDLLSAGGIEVAMMNFDFDLSFKASSFVMSATVPSGYTTEELSTSDRYTNNQIDLIKSLSKNQKIYIEEIKAIGPDGKERKMNSMVFVISGE
jgi:hypothetical protein